MPQLDANSSDTVQASLDYLVPSSRVNRRYIAPGAELNTGRYAAHRVAIRDARPLARHITLDTHGFVLANRPSAMADFMDRAQIDAIYTAEVLQSVAALCGADVVAALGFQLRSAEVAGDGVQPPASDVHVDMTGERAARVAKTVYERDFPGHPPFKRFIASSLWRALSKPPQDWPLALCDGSSVRPQEGLPNTLVIVDALPDWNAIPSSLPDESLLPAASVFHFSPDHRWYYFPDMTRDEVLMIKFHDSDHGTAWRSPHASFRDERQVRVPPRQSIEFRTIAYFL